LSENEHFVDNLPEDSFQKLFWQQQIDALGRSGSKKHGIRWHPLMIRWCLTAYIFTINPEKDMKH
jgi:hypothetical protein